jgi:hypothetical protein
VAESSNLSGIRTGSTDQFVRGPFSCCAIAGFAGGRPGYEPRKNPYPGIGAADKATILLVKVQPHQLLVLDA